jgi:hypothetical protein
MSLIVGNHSFDIYLTGSPPNQLRFRILNADASFKVRVSMSYPTSLRIDVYMNGSFIQPTNAYYVNGNMLLNVTDQNTVSYMPTYLNMSGANFFNNYNQKVYFVMDGLNYIDLIIAPVLYVKFGFPALTPDAFFNPATIADKFALLLGLNPSQIKRVDITKATRSTGKKRQTADSLNYVGLTFYENPILSNKNISAVNYLITKMNQLSANISNLFSSGQLQLNSQVLLNVSLTSMSLQQPISNQLSGMQPQLQPVVKVNSIKILKNADECRAQTPCQVQPQLMILDENVRFNYTKVRKKTITKFRIESELILVRFSIPLSVC